jgi:hypothetical protein
VTRVVQTVRRQGWRKFPDIPLGQFVEQQRQRREARFGRKAAAKAARKKRPPKHLAPTTVGGTFANAGPHRSLVSGPCPAN